MAGEGTSSKRSGREHLRTGGGHQVKGQDHFGPQGEAGVATACCVRGDLKARPLGRLTGVARRAEYAGRSGVTVAIRQVAAQEKLESPLPTLARRRLLI